MAITTWRQLNAHRDHRWAQPRISDYVDRELPRRHQRRLAAHAELCPECAHLIATLQALLTVLPSLRLQPHVALAIAESTAGRVAAMIEEWS